MKAKQCLRGEEWKPLGQPAVLLSVSLTSRWHTSCSFQQEEKCLEFFEIVLQGIRLTGNKSLQGIRYTAQE